VNLWTFEGMAGQVLLWTVPIPRIRPGDVRLRVTNNTATSATGVMLTDAMTDSGGTTVVPIAGPFDLGG